MLSCISTGEEFEIPILIRYDTVIQKGSTPRTSQPANHPKAIINRVDRGLVGQLRVGSRLGDQVEVGVGSALLSVEIVEVETCVCVRNRTVLGLGGQVEVGWLLFVELKSGVKVETCVCERGTDLRITKAYSL
jgi:hypothetical protein